MDVLKNFKKTIFWFIALAALFGASQLIDDRVEEAERVEQANLKLFPFEIGQVAEFWINSAKDGVRARLSKETDGWRLNQPLAAKGDDEAVTNLLRNIVNSRKDAILFENPEPAKLAELGLDKPELEISFKTRDGVTTMEFGDKGPTLNVTYGRFKGETAIYRIHSDVRTEADTSVYTLRDKSTLVFDPLKLKRMEIMRRGRDMVVVRLERGRWDMLLPLPARADQAKVLETLYAIKDTPVKAFIDEAPNDLGLYGLQPPSISVTITEQGKEGAQVLYIGGKDRKRRGYFARSNSSQNVVLLEEKLVKSLLADGEWWKEAG
ncbi:MAG: DUF4340 domain-containing protein [Alphaproteobacteria bacterium]|nr:DUF4340 domain-containing protein [Alphaproteobacteria bacterium]MDP6873037.1 DUF4340 domain-containing protein [Alphaproteobacteria bacterium]